MLFLHELPEAIFFLIVISLRLFSCSMQRDRVNMIGQSNFNTKMRDTLEQLQIVFNEVFQDDETKLIRETSAADIEAWDSLSHVTLVLRVESHFGVRFSSSEIAGLKNVGELVDLVGVKSA